VVGAKSSIAGCASVFKPTLSMSATKPKQVIITAVDIQRAGRSVDDIAILFTVLTHKVIRNESDISDGDTDEQILRCRDESRELAYLS
jgi:hypothetical protein